MKCIVTLLVTSCLSLSAIAQVPSGYALYYPFTGNYDDSSGHGINATGINTSFVADRFGHPNSAIYFNGTNAKVISQYKPSNLSAFTFSVWVKTDAINTGNAVTRQIMDFRGQSGSGNYGLELEYWEYDGTYGFGLGGDYVWNSQRLTYNNDNTWTHIACVWNPAGASQFSPGQFRIYINGVLQNSLPYNYNPNAYTLPAVPYSAPAQMALGAIGATSNTFYYKGAMDDIFIYEKALTSAQIDSVYHSAPLGIENNVADRPLSIYPVPAANHIYLAGLNNNDGDISVTITNAMGQKIMSNVLTANNNATDISSLSTGIYYMIINAEKDDRKKILKFIKQ